MKLTMTNEKAIENLICIKVGLRPAEDEVKETVELAIESLKMQEPAEWLDGNYTEYFNGGGFLEVRGYRCSNCGFFRRKRLGKSEFCENCGRRMTEKEKEE